MDADGELLHQHSGQRTVEAFAKSLEAAKATAAVRKRAESGDAAARRSWFETRMAFKLMPYQDAKREFEALKITDKATRSRMEGLLRDLDYRDRSASLPTEAKSREAALDDMAKWLDIANGGPDGAEEARGYYNLMMSHAVTTRNTKLQDKIVAHATARNASRNDMDAVLKSLKSMVDKARNATK